MKKIFLLSISIVLMASCSVKTNEEKARELIEPQVKSNLIKPESYEFGMIKLDSCFSDSGHNPDIIAFGLKVAKLWKEYKEHTSDAERAESYMSIYTDTYDYGSSHSKLQYEKYKAEVEKAQRKADYTKEKIIQMYKDNKKMFKDFQSGKHEFIGWAAAFGFRTETAGGMKTMGEVLFFLNKDLTEITHRFTEEDMEDVQSASVDDIPFEFEEELKEIFEAKWP